MIRIKRLYAHNFKQLAEIELHLPDAARVLVQGRNEAGKSTLFEAVFFALFGTALATETNTRGLDALIAYETEKARVELDLAVNNRLFKIARTIVRGKPNLWELDVFCEGAPPEEIRGNSAVNKRLVAELGFDGDALLNTCFVEQKKLEKLEGLSKAKREESLAKLLNLDAMVDLENDLKLRSEDRQELDRLKKRAELADVQSDLPPCENELSSVESKLHLIDLRRAVQGAVEEMSAVRQLDSAIGDLTARRDSLAEKAERIDALRQAMLCVKEARDAVERMAESTQEIDRMRVEQTQALHAVQEGEALPARAQALRHLSHSLQRLDRIRQAISADTERAAALGAAQARLSELAATAAREQDLMSQTETRLHDYEIGDVLGRWTATRQAIVAQEELDAPLREKRAARAQLSRRFRLEMYALGLALLIFVLGAAFIQPLAIVFLMFAALTLAALAVRVTILWREIAQTSEELGKVEAQAQAAAAENRVRMDVLKEIEARLGELGVPVPETADLAHSQRVAIARTLENKTIEELRSEEALTRERLLNARAVLGELQQQNDIEHPEKAEVELARCRAHAEKAQTVLARAQTRVQAMADRLSIEPDPNVIQRMLYQLDAQGEQLQRRAADAARLGKEMARREEQGRTLADRARVAYEQAREVKPGAAEWSGALSTRDYTAFGKELRTEYDSLGGEAVVKQTREVEGELGRRQGEREMRAKNSTTLLARVQQLLREIGKAGELSDPPELAELEELGTRFRSIDLGNETALRAQQRELVGRIRSYQDRRSQLERELGLAGELLDRAACHVELSEKARQMQVRERGVEIVSLARRRIVQKVLPATMDYMRQILPTLTRNRYHDAQLDPESYKIQVWDERAGSGGAFKEKNIFSGGTKDQFSLALRLAFALATLPQERGTAPSFIFLDEPLGSFDQERAQALVYLLTEGEIAHAFDQILLISHVHVDERLFTHHVTLEDGRVQYSDLPVPTSS